MPRIVRSVVLVCILAFVACAQPSDTVGVSSSAAGLELGDLEATVRTLQEKLMSLAAAMPEEDLNWRPMDGVRSVGEVYVHIAADNWYVPALLGWQAPAETGVTSDGATFQTYQSRTMERDELLRALDASFEFLLASMADSADDLAREVTLGTPTTVGDVWIRATVHLHEHLGQSIAYARMNEIVPPWSR